MRTALTACLAAGVLGVAGAAGAHCSFAMFDQSRTVQLKGVVAEFQWTAPHAFFEIDVPGGKGVERWSVETNSAGNLHRGGWRASDFRPGDKITIFLNPMRNGQKAGLFKGVVMQDGGTRGEVPAGLAAAKSLHRRG